MDEITKGLDMKGDALVSQVDASTEGASASGLFEEFYDDWAAFDQAIAIAIEKHHPIRKRSSLTFEVYNRTVSKGRHDRKAIAEFLSKTFKCTHGIKFRSRGTGKRSRHKLRDIGCPFHIYATAVEFGATYRVKVRTHDLHNHAIGPDAIKTVGAVHDSDYEIEKYADEQAALEAAASSVSTGGLQVEAQAFAHVPVQAHVQDQDQLQSHVHSDLNGHASAADILDAGVHESESLLDASIDTQIGEFTAAAVAAAAAVVESASTVSRVLEPSSKFEASTTLEELRRKLAQFAQERDWEQFHSPRNLLLALAGEMGELCECFQWKGDSKPVEEWTAEERVHLGEEMSDVMMYLIRLADRCNIDLPTAINDKMIKNAEKYPAELVKGSSKKYNEFKRARLDREASL